MPIVVEENFIVEPEEFCIPEIELIDDGYRIKLNDKIRESFLDILPRLKAWEDVKKRKYR